MIKKFAFAFHVQEKKKEKGRTNIGLWIEISTCRNKALQFYKSNNVAFGNYFWQYGYLV